MPKPSSSSISCSSWPVDNKESISKSLKTQIREKLDNIKGEETL